MIEYILIGLNVLLMGFLIFEFVKNTKKKHYALILNKNGEVVKQIKINPAYKNFDYEYKSKNYTHLLPEDTPFMKLNRIRIVLYEFEKPEPINPVKNFESRMFASLFNELLQMSKIKALNEVKNGFFDKIDKKYIFIGAVVIIIIIMVVSKGGF